MAAVLRDEERVRRVLRDVVGEVACVGGREADFEGRELESGEAMGDCLHARMNSKAVGADKERVRPGRVY